MHALRLHADEWGKHGVALMLGFVFVLYLTAASFTLGRLTAPKPVLDVDLLHEQYARGAYDVCVALFHAEDRCMRAVEDAMNLGVYDMHSDGFVWGRGQRD